jgi:hypothetical protein
LGHKAKWEYFRAVYERYHRAEREAKQVMLNEFCLNTGYHRKYAIRLLNGAPPGKQRERRRRERRPRYGPQVLSVLAAIWEAAGYPWSVRLKALLPNWMPWIRKCYRMTPQMEKQLLGISARQIDRRLQAKKSERKRRIYERTKPGSLLKHQDGLPWVLANDRDGLGRGNVEARIPIFLPRDAIEVLFNDLLSPRQSITAAHWKIMADRQD